MSCALCCAAPSFCTQPQFLVWPLEATINKVWVSAICELLTESYQVALEMHRLELNLACAVPSQDYATGNAL